jgi:hypothetical protein
MGASRKSGIRVIKTKRAAESRLLADDRAKAERNSQLALLRAKFGGEQA